MAATQYPVTSHDAEVLRGLGRRMAELAHDPENLERKRLWLAHDAGRGERPLILAESWVSFEDAPDSVLHCGEEWARELEKSLRFEIYRFEKVRDDQVIEPYVGYRWNVQVSDYGVASKQEHAARVSGNVSSRRWEPPIKDMEADLDKLHPRTFSVDRESTAAKVAALHEVFDGILGVRPRGGYWWTTGLTITAIDLIGLENMMLYMCTEPDNLHRLMAFLQADMLAYMEWLEREQLLGLNNENDYIGSGSMGYTRALPGPDWSPGDPVRLRNTWALCESQETVGCSPAQFDEFVVQYLAPIAARFGRVYYGCCEPVHDRWEYVQKLPNVARVSISPWCDQNIMAGLLGRDYAFSRKPNPTLVSTPEFSEDLIRDDLRATMKAARDCNLEIIMKDVHTLCGQPERLARWVELCREMTAELY